MKQTLHLLIVDPLRTGALAARYRSKWLLPMLTCAERARPAPLVARWAADRGIAGDVAGQWLGRVTPQGADWLVVLVASAAVPREQALEWLRFDALASTSAVIEYQRWAVTRALDDAGRVRVNGPFGNLDWPADVREWIAARTEPLPGLLVPYRVSAHEVVLGVNGRCFFKGLAAERAAEVSATIALAEIAPQAFPATLALDRHRDGSVWWLTAACPGRPPADAHGAARQLARIQQRLTCERHQALGLETVDLESVCRWTCDLLGGVAARDVVAPAFAVTTAVDVPRSWIPMDLDLTNLVADAGGAVRFIDVDDSFLGPAPLAIALLGQRSGDRTIYRTYEQSWCPSLEGIDWERFEVVASAIDAWLGWKRVVRNIERGELDVAPDLVTLRIRERLILKIYCR